MAGSERSRPGSESGRGGAFLASEVMMLAYHLSQISRDDIVAYKLDRVKLPPSDLLDRDGSVAASGRSTRHIVQLHRLLQRHLEDTTIELLAECVDMDVSEIDTTRIARELESFCVDSASISLRRLKGMLHTSMQDIERLPACLQLLLHLKDAGGSARLRSVTLAAADSCSASRRPTPVSNKREFREFSDDSSSSDIASSATVSSDASLASAGLISPEGPAGPAHPVAAAPPLVPTPLMDPLGSVGSAAPAASVDPRVVTDRFEFAEIDEADLVSDILFALQGVEGRFIKRDFDGCFKLTADRKVSRGVRQLTNRICVLGRLYNSIVCVDVPGGLISQALHQGVMEEVHQYNRLVNMLVAGRQNEALSLRQLYVWVQQPYTRMRLLHVALCCSHQFSIDHIFELYCSRGDAMGRELYNELLRKCMVPYLEILLHWVYLGELHDPSALLFVKVVDGRFHLVAGRAPKFMPRPLAGVCFEAGCCSRYYAQVTSASALRGGVDVPGLIRELCPEGAAWSVFETVERLSALVRSVDSSRELVRVLIRDHDLVGYVDRVRRHLGMCCLGADPSTSCDFADFELTKEFGFDMYVPRFSFPLNLVLEDERVARECYVNSFRLEFLLQRTLKVLSLSWSEYRWSSRCSHGALDLSRRLSWINLCRNEMSHFAHVLQCSRSAQFVLERFCSSLGARAASGPGLSFEELRAAYSSVLCSLSIDNFLELLEVLESIVDFCKVIPRLFSRGAMQQLQSLVRGGAPPSDLVAFVHRNIATDDVMKVLSRHARRFRENVLHLLRQMLCQGADLRRFGSILDYNGFYHLLRAVGP